MTTGFTLDQEPAGVQVISNPKSPRPPDGKRKRILFKEELSIGASEGDENYMFGESIRREYDPIEITRKDKDYFKNGWLAVVATEGGYKFAKRYALRIVDEGQK